MAKAPKVVNAALGSKSGYKPQQRKTVGYVDAPLMSVPTLKKSPGEQRAATLRSTVSRRALSEQKKQHVLIVQDPFTSFWRCRGSRRLRYSGSEAWQKHRCYCRLKPNGKALHIKRLLKSFCAWSEINTSDFLSMVADIGIPLVGVDPALVLCYRDEYVEILADKRGRLQCTHRAWMVNAIVGWVWSSFCKWRYVVLVRSLYWEDQNAKRWKSGALSSNTLVLR